MITKAMRFQKPVLSLLAVVGTFISGTLSRTEAQESSGSPPAVVQGESFPDLAIPPNASLKQLQDIVQKAKSVRPTTGPQYQAMQTAIRNGSQKILGILKGKNDTADYRRAELDTITASVALMTFAGPDAQKKTLEQIHAFLKKREKLSLQDAQTGIMAAAMLELQPNKRPARSTYELLDELLKDDEREEMQSLRVNLQANIRRLALLGEEMKLKVKSIDGKTLDVQNYSGKFLLINFFTTWNNACREEIPRLKGHYEKFRSKGLEVIGISLDSDRAALDKYLENARLPWPIVHDSAENPLETLQIEFGISQLPTVLLLNKEGTVVSLEARGGELDRLMQMLFETPTPAPAKAEASKPGEN